MGLVVGVVHHLTRRYAANGVTEHMKAKKQHWVPRFYLKSFTIEGRSDLAWCIPKSKKPFQSNIKDIASKKIFILARK
ncbi:DUF4238 domain-containing protein [Vibrio parahaemolyticus]|nr:DUF4238 domain-containing protein [Vibrio parahaemolyticus]